MLLPGSASAGGKPNLVRFEAVGGRAPLHGIEPHPSQSLEDRDRKKMR